MKKFDDQLIINRIDQAPGAVRALIGLPIARTVTAIGKSYQLHVDQTGAVAELTRNTLLGLVSPTEFFAGLIEAGLDNATAQKITAEVNRQVFAPLREQMKKSSAGAGDGVVPGPRPMPPQPPPPAANPALTDAAQKSFDRPLREVNRFSPDYGKPLPSARQAPAPAPASPGQSSARTPITDPQRELPVGEVPAGIARAPSAPLPPKAALPRRPLPPPAPQPFVAPRPVPPQPPRAPAPTPPIMPAQSAALPPANLPGAPVQPRPSPSPEGPDPYREPIE